MSRNSRMKPSLSSLTIASKPLSTTGVPGERLAPTAPRLRVHRGREVHHDGVMPALGAGDQDDLAIDEFVALLLSGHPGEELRGRDRRLIKFDVHAKPPLQPQL